MNRLATATETGAWSQTYDCDRYGNRAVRAGSYVPPANIGLTPQSADSTDFSAFDQPTNRLSKNIQPQTNVDYDNAGNLKHDAGSGSYSYDAENRLVHFNSGTGQYFYDGDGRRVKKIDNTGTTVFVYNVAGQLIAEYTSGTPSGSGTSYLTSDHLGSTRVVTKSDGTVKARYDYLPFGEEIPSTVGSRSSVAGYGAADSTRQKFTQKERDNESGLDYFLARYYSSAQGRFTSPDEFAGGPREFWVLGSGDPQKQALAYADIANPQSLNKYQYAYGNPLRYVDPNGHGPDILVIEGGPTEGNPIGHTAIAVTGYGVFSFGNRTELGSSPSAYIQREAPKRDTTLYVIKTTPEQDKAAVDTLLKQDEKGGIGVTSDNCSSRSNCALDAAGVPNAPGTVNPAGPTVYPANPGMPGTAGKRAEELPKDKVTKIEIPKGSTTVPAEVKQFEPKTPNPDPRLPKKENNKAQSSS